MCGREGGMRWIRGGEGARVVVEEGKGGWGER